MGYARSLAQWDRNCSSTYIQWASTWSRTVLAGGAKQPYSRVSVVLSFASLRMAWPGCYRSRKKLDSFALCIFLLATLSCEQKDVSRSSVWRMDLRPVEGPYPTGIAREKGWKHRCFFSSPAAAHRR